VNDRVACGTYGYGFLSLEGALERIAETGFRSVDIDGTRPHLGRSLGQNRGGSSARRDDVSGVERSDRRPPRSQRRVDALQ
jgi:hypothetical protein